MKRKFVSGAAFVLAVASAFLLILSAGPVSAAAWKFGVMSDTQWTVPDDGKNPDTVAVGIIDQINARFIDAGVKFVVQVGDLTDDGSEAAMDTRAAAARALYKARIGFFPFRGNHEKKQSAALRFQADFPQTRGKGARLFGATHFSSPEENLAGLSYAFDYKNARFVLLDQFTRTDGTGSTSDEQNNSNIADQQSWINGRLSGRTSGTHAFVFGHKNLIGENHVDVLLGSDPSQNAAARNAFIGSLAENNVRYCISGHDHIHQRSIVESPDGNHQVQEIISSSNSSKFYIPADPSNDATYNSPQRETSISQEIGTVGYYIYTVDGANVTVDFYSAKIHPKLEDGEYLLYKTPNLKFTKRESFGYSLKGKQFQVAQGASYTSVKDSYNDTEAGILTGTNTSTVEDGSGRPLTKIVNTGWSDKTSTTLSPILTLWGMAKNLGSDRTDVYALAMKTPSNYVNGKARLVVRSTAGGWVNAVDLNYGGHAKYVTGPWSSRYSLGTYGYDPDTRTAWAVINHAGDFAVALQ